MDQAVTDGIQHLRLFKEEEEKSSISITRSDLLEECTLSPFGRAFKSTLGTAWKLGSDSRIVDVGINDFHFKICSSYQMEWLPNFCFIGGVLGPVEKHCSGYQGKSDFLRHFGDWTKEISGFKGVFEKKADSSGGLEERMEEGIGVQHNPMAASQVSLGTEQAKHSIVLSNLTSSNNTNRRQGSLSVMLSVENQSIDVLVRPLSLTPSSDVHSRDSQKSSIASDMGFQMLSSVAQNEPTNTPLCPKRGNLKFNTQAQNIAGLSGGVYLVVVVCYPSCLFLLYLL